MPEEQTQVDEQTEGQQQAGEGEQTVTSRDLLERIEALQAGQNALIERQAASEPVETQQPPAPAQPPPRPEGRVTREDYTQLADWAAGQRREVERYRLAAQYGLDVSELEGDFESPLAMEAHARMVQLRKQVEGLEEQLRQEQETREGEGVEAPAADTGGPTGQQPTASDVDEAYARARELGSTEAGRRALLEAIYQDPTKRLGRMNQT